MSTRTLLTTGLGLTALGALLPVIDMATVDTVGEHVRAVYPQWSAAMIAADRNAIVIYLGIVGLVGIACWLWAIRVANRRSARAARTSLLAVGATIALTNRTFSGGAYGRVVPIGYGLLGLLPVVAGVAATVRAWKRGPNAVAPRSRALP